MNRLHRSAGDRIFDAVNIFLFVLFGLTILLPFWFEITKSLSGEAYIATHNSYFWPDKLVFSNWKTLLHSARVWNAFKNSVFVVLSACAYSLFLSVTFAYPLSRRDLPHRNLLTFILAFTMYFSGGLIPTYLLYKNLGALNTYVPLIVGGLSAWNTLIIRNFFMSVPEDIQESARIDGATEVTVLFKIMLPLSMPVLATVTLWNLVGGWNAWVPCMIYVNDSDMWTLQYVLRNLMFSDALPEYAEMDMSMGLSNYTVEGYKSAMLLFTLLPIVCTYPFLQRYFVKGIMVGAIKG